MPGSLLGSVSGELGLRKYVESNGHKFVVTSDKDGPRSVFERELPDAEVVISQPFWPAYLTADLRRANFDRALMVFPSPFEDVKVEFCFQARLRIAKAKKLKPAITAGIGSDHVDLGRLSVT